MKKARGILGLMVLAWALGPASSAQEEAGWKKLFDGKTLKGWKAANYATPGKVQVTDGAIVMEEGKRMTGVVYTGGDFPKMNYEVTLEAKKLAGEDFFCCTTFPVGDSWCSFVVGGWGGRVVGLSRIDSEDAVANETRKDRTFKRDQWYRIRIRVTKSRIETWIDRDKMVDLDTTDRRISIRLECTACRPFGFATFETKGAVRDVRLRLLGEEKKKG